MLRERHGPPVWNLPKGHVELGEELSVAALREVREETGLSGRIVAPLRPIRYRFRLPGDSAIYAKTVHFFLMRAVSGTTGQHDAEVLQARWMPLSQALVQLAHENERRVLRRAQRLLAALRPDAGRRRKP